LTAPRAHERDDAELRRRRILNIGDRRQAPAQRQSSRGLLHAIKRSPDTRLDIESVSTDVTIVVEVSGDVDLLTALALSEEPRRAQRTRSEVIVDLEKVDLMGCAALRVSKSIKGVGPAISDAEGLHGVPAGGTGGAVPEG
jgi:hypothetical protein